MKTKYLLLSGESVKKAIWEIKEPLDKTDPVEHERFIRMDTDYGMLLGASIRGKNHEHHGRWREDAFCIEHSGAFTIMAAADGAGSCSLSRVGADIACKTVVNFLKVHLSRAADVEMCLKEAAIQSVTAIEKEARKRQINKHQLSTTLLLAVYGRIKNKPVIAALQVGDGVICIRNQKNEITVLGYADHGEYGGQSLFLTAEGITDKLERKISLFAPDNLKSIAILTDGIADDFFPLEKELKRFFEQIDNTVLSGSQPSEAVKKWIRYEKSGSYDDRTLIFFDLNHLKTGDRA